jgi:ribose transport system substrate-binding protein
MMNGALDLYKVYLITMDKQDQHWYRVNDGASDMAAIAGINYIWDAPDTKDNRRQIEILNNAVAEGADLILLAASDPLGISRAIEDAKSKGVRIIYVDSPAYEEAIVTLSTDNYEAGRTAGTLMLSFLEAEGITGGSIGIIGVNTVTNSTISREEGFREMITLDGKFNLLPTQYMGGDPFASQKAATDLIMQNNDLVGIFASNEGSTIGVGNAIRENNPEIIGIGFDRSEEILRLIENGSLNAVVAQNPYTMGYLGMSEAIAALSGKDTGPSMIDTGVSIITR